MRIYRTYILPLFLLLLGAVAAQSCVDELIERPDEVPDGETEMAMSVSYRSFTPALEGSRSAGNAIKEINDLWILIYENKEGKWALEKDGKIKIGEQHGFTPGEKQPDNRPDGAEQAETETGHAKFRLRHPNGQFRIFAVANYDLSKVDDTLLDTPEKLRKLELKWDEHTDSLFMNAQMFGEFSNDAHALDSEGPVNVGPNAKLHAWVRRAASKITVAIDGSKLLDGVYVLPIAVVIKDIPRRCLLGDPNTVAHKDSLIPEGETLKLFQGPAGSEAPSPGQLEAGYPGVITNKTELKRDEAHSESAPALYFYENMQGTGKDKKQTKEGGKDNELLYSTKDDKPFGTYIEVHAIYNCTRSERKGNGLITYRFMLGKDIATNYDAERNYHYKLTLNLNNYANDYDWHIDYEQQVFQVGDPKVFNYQGQVFIPQDWIPNRGNKFRDENEILVTSYMTNSKDLVPWQAEFREGKTGSFSTTPPSWLHMDSVVDSVYPYIKRVTFTADMVDPKVFNVSDYFKTARGTKSDPINLADPKRATCSPNSAVVTCSANCYMIDGPGWYLLPLVYGNAYHGGSSSTDPYTYSSESDLGGKVLKTFKNCKGKEITSPDIVTDLGLKGKENQMGAYIVWQDVDNLVDYDLSGEVWGDNRLIEYLPKAYGGKGGIRFYVTKAEEGNAVIAIGDKFVPGTTNLSIYSALPDIYWSWHIWMTSFEGFNKEDRTIEVTGHEEFRHFEMMPFNLGWCSGGEEIRYYPGRECTVRFTAGDKVKEITIVQKSHIAIPMGNSTYYQWGRKDPFVGANIYNGSKPEIKQNKTMYFNKTWSETLEILPLLTPIPADIAQETDVTKVDSTKYNAGRYTGIEAVDAGILIRQPYKWHNPKVGKINGKGEWISKDATYTNLWVGRPGVDPKAKSLKTIYDPCPVGFQVPHYNCVSGFTTSGGDPGLWKKDGDLVSQQWMDVWKDHIPSENPKENLFEFYTNREKTQSIVFPQSGYRDFNSYGSALKVNIIGYLWMAGNPKNKDNKFSNFEFSRFDTDFKEEERRGGYIRPHNEFYPCDGFPIRPCVYDPH